MGEQVSRLVGVQKGWRTEESCVYPTVPGTAPSPTQRRFSRDSHQKLKLEMQRAGEDGRKLSKCLVVEEFGSSVRLAYPKDNRAPGARHEGWDAQEAAEDLRTLSEISNIYGFSPQRGVASCKKYLRSL